MTRLLPTLLIAWLACAQVSFLVYAGVAAGLAVTSVLAYKKAGQEARPEGERIENSGGV